MSSSPRVALVTGAGVRLGQAIANRLEQEGLVVARHYHRSRPLEAGPAFCVDLSQRQGPKELASAVLGELGRVDVLINSAAVFFPSPSLEQSEEDWDTFLDLNLRAPFLLVRHLAESLRQQQGCIVNVTDIYAQRPLARHLPYCVSKGALWSLTQSLALELAPEVRVNAVAPGAALAPAGAPPETAERLAQALPLQRMGSGQDIAQAVSYLVNAPFVTGQMLCVDGGRTLRM